MSPILRHTADHLIKNWRIGIPTVAVIGFAFLLLNLLLFANQIGKSFVTVMKGSLSFTVYLQDGTDPFTLRNIISDLEKLPEVSPPVIYTSSEEAMRKFGGAAFGGAAFGGAAAENINGGSASYPASLAITPVEPEDRAKIEAFLAKSPYRPFLSLSASTAQTEEEKIYSRITSQIERLQTLIQGIMFTLLGFSFLVIITVIFASLKLGGLSRKRELIIMKIVGASPYYLEFPYLLEAMSYGALGLLLGTAAFMLLPALKFFPSDAFLQEQMALFPIGNIFVFELIFAFVVSFGAAFLSIRNIVRKT